MKRKRITNPFIALTIQIRADEVSTLTALAASRRATRHSLAARAFRPGFEAIKAERTTNTDTNQALS